MSTTTERPAHAGPDTPRDLPQLGLAAAVVLIKLGLLARIPW